MKSQTKPVKSQRPTSKCLHSNRCGDDICKAQDKNDTFKVESWDDIKDKPFEIMLTQDLADRIGWPLEVKEDGTWWVQVNKKK